VASRLRDAAPPAYLFCCLILGGSSQGIWANMLLQLFGLALIVWAALMPAGERLPRQQRQLFGLVILGLTLIALQLIPLSPALWEPLGPRHLLADGYKILGIPAPSLPLSVAPYDTLTAVLALIPALAMLVSTIRLGCRPAWLVIAVIAGTVAGILLGALQVSSPDPLASPWYLYEDTNNGVATGFFANANHMAILLVISLPFLAAILASAGAKGRNVQRYSAVVALIAGAALVVAVGIALNGSLAGYGLAVPVLVASAVIVLPARNRAIRWLAPAAAILLIGAVGWLATTPLSSRDSLEANAATSVSSRQEILTTSMRATRAFMPLGAGVGTFRRVYALYEDHDRLDPTTYVNHAHNDYLELALETGVPGLAVLALFLLWWGRAAWRAWRQREPDPFARAAAVASAAILVHSVVDFPLRTAAIGACFTLCLVLLVRQKPARAAEKSDLWSPRHVVVT
jgi:O-antigen ligase